MNLSLFNLYFEALGIDIKSFTITDNLIRFIRVFPLLIEHFHMLEQGPPNTGKSYISKVFPENFEMVKAITTAKIFGSISGKEGYISNKNNAIFFDEISNLNQSDIPTDLKSALKSYLNGDTFSRGNDEILQTTSCYFAGNTSDDIQNKLDISPVYYNKDSLSNLPEFFLENAMIERLIWLPGWLLSKTQEKNLLFNSNSEKALEEIKDFIKKNRTAENKEVKIPFTTNTRDCKKARKLITGLIISLYNGDFKSNNINEVIEFSKFIVNLGYGKYSKFWETHDGKKFISNFLEIYLPINSTIDRIFFYNDRVLVVTKENPNKIYKIAINKYGVLENQKEINFYNNKKEFSNLIAHIEKTDDLFIVAIQDYYEFLDNKNEFKNACLSPIEAQLKNLTEEVNKLKNINEKLNSDILVLINQYNLLLNYTFSLTTGAQVPRPSQILFQQNNINIALNDFNQKLSNLTKNICYWNIGFRNNEYRLINLSDFIL